MARQNKCLRCKKKIESGVICQDCKSALIPFYESAQDWHLAIEMEAQQKYLYRFTSDVD